MADIVSGLTAVAHSTFEVDAVRVRSGEDDADIRVVLHLDAEVWDVQGPADGIARKDMVSVRSAYSLESGDIITVSDTSAVVAASSWRITGRVPDNSDGHVEMWAMRKVLP